MCTYYIHRGLPCIGGAFAKIPYFLNHGAVHLSMPAVDHSPIKTYSRMNERSGVEQEEYQYENERNLQQQYVPKRAAHD